jgi:hypothetical protein
MAANIKVRREERETEIKERRERRRETFFVPSSSPPFVRLYLLHTHKVSLLTFP